MEVRVGEWYDMSIGVVIEVVIGGWWDVGGGIGLVGFDMLHVMLHAVSYHMIPDI